MRQKFAFSLSALAIVAALPACKLARIEPFGETKLSALCADEKRCETRGDSVINLLKLKGPQRMYLAPDKGPEQLLGKVAPERNVESVLKTCGAEVSVNDWLAAPEALRTFALGDNGKVELRERLRSYLSARAGALSVSEKQTVDASLTAVVQAVPLDRVSWVSQTYWLNDTAFERRVTQCGEEERENIVYSLTVIAPSQAFQTDLSLKLERALNDKLGAKDTASDDAGAADESGLATEPPEEPAPAADDEGSTLVRHDTLARDVVRALARDTRVIAALGFDDL
jgi:hypothetical protein